MGREQEKTSETCSSCGAPSHAGHMPDCARGKEGEATMPTSVDLYVFRHAKTDYKERAHVKEKGTWASEMHDVTEEGEEKVREKAEAVAEELDPQKHVVVFLSSPRARAMATERILEDAFTKRGFTIRRFGGDTSMVNMIRSGGDTSAQWGEGNMIVQEKSDADTHLDLDKEEEEKNTGKRFREFLSYFAAIDQKRLAKINKEKFGEKIPVFIATTHGEVVHGERSSEESFRQSLLGKVFSDRPFMKKGTRLDRGKYFKLSFDLEHPGTMTFRQKTKGGIIEEKLHYDQRTGEVRTE